MRTRLIPLMVTLALLLPAGSWAASPGALYVTNGLGNSIAQFGIGAGGLLNPLSPPTVTAANPSTAVITPDGKHVYALGNSTLYAWDVQSDLTLVPHNPPSFTSPVAGGAWMGVSPDGKSLYLADFGNSIGQVTIGAGGDLTDKAPATVGGGPQVFSVAMTPDGKYLYGLNVGGNSITRYDVAADGTLTAQPGSTTTGSVPAHMVVTPDGRYAYVTDENGNTVHQYAIGADGSLTPLNPASVVTSPNPSPNPDGIGISPDGNTVYATNISDSTNAIVPFDVGSDGTLAAKPGGAVSAAQPLMLMPTPDGRSVYVTSIGGHAVLEYDAAADGTLTPKSTASVPSGGNPTQLLTVPDQGPTAAFTASPASSPATFDASSSSDPDGTIARYDWDFGDGSTSTTTTPTTSHTYAAPGTFTVRLRVTDDTGCSGEVFTGRDTLCNDHGSVVTHDVTVPAPSTSPTGDGTPGDGTPSDGTPGAGPPTGGPVDQTPEPRPTGRHAKRCRVPRLKHATLKQARKRLRKANCRLGKVTRRPPAGDRLVVVAQRPKPGKKRKARFPVRVTVSGRA